jgi:hypothetical protein
LLQNDFTSSDTVPTVPTDNNMPTSAAAGIRIHDHRHTSNLSHSSYIIRHSMRVDRRRPGKPQAGRGPGNFKLNRDFMATKALLGALPACVRVL